MISNLLIENFLLIKNSQIDFDDKLNIISGETGSGKSMLLSSLSFVFGEKFNADVIGKFKDYAEVTVVVTVNSKNKMLLGFLNENSIETDEESKIYINRTIKQNGKSVIKVNGKLTSVTIVKNLKSFVLDVHSQHQHQLLLHKEHHIELLDCFADENLDNLKNSLKSTLKEYRDLASRLKKISGNPNDRERKLDLLTYQINEISEASLYEGIDEELHSRRDFLQSIEKITTASNNAYEILTYGQNSNSVINLLSEVESEVSKILDFDSDSEEINLIMDNIVTANEHLRDVKKDLLLYKDNLSGDEKELEEITEKLHSINRLGKKYGGTVSGILAFMENAKKEKGEIEESEDEAIRLAQEQKSLKVKINDLCVKISEIRYDCGLKIVDELVEVLKSLGMKDVDFKVDITKTKEITNNGFDKVTFLISTNKGSKLESIDKIASGGEMSRVMLGLKSVLAHRYNIETFVFDEIDTGVSGRTAQKVAERLKLLSKSHQIICITHLPQIASMSDIHLCISKEVVGENTITNIKSLDIEESIQELSRLIGGAKITEQTKKASSEMKRLAMEYDSTLN
ncbi:MAG: DNA repair protein RecN [Lachnospirales bacterium]